MKVDKIKKLPSGKYKINLDTNDKIVTYDDVILKNNLLFNKEIDSEKLNEINKDTDYYKLYSSAVNLISKRIRSEKEVREYLGKKTTIESDINKIVDDLKLKGLINDRMFAKAFIADRLHFSSSGPYLIIKELEMHEIASNIIEEEIANVDIEELKSKLDKLINKKIRANTKYSFYILKQKIITQLIGNGFDKDMIISILDNINYSNNAIEKEFDKLYSKLSKKGDKNIVYNIKNKLYQKGFSMNEIDEVIKKIDRDETD